jgi:sulfur dioxygenase
MTAMLLAVGAITVLGLGILAGRALTIRAAMGKIRGIRSTAERLGVREVMAEDLARELASEEVPAILDVRMAQEFTGPHGHLAGSRLVTLSELHVRIGDLADWRDRPVVTVCAAGVRSAQAVEILQQAGFRDVRSLSGGMIAWLQQGLPVDR